MRKILVLLNVTFALVVGACQSYQVTEFKVLDPNQKAGKTLYQMDVIERKGLFGLQATPMIGLICVSDSAGNLTCR